MILRVRSFVKSMRVAALLFFVTSAPAASATDHSSNACWKFFEQHRFDQIIEFVQDKVLVEISNIDIWSCLEFSDEYPGQSEFSFAVLNLIAGDRKFGQDRLFEMRTNLVAYTYFAASLQHAKPDLAFETFAELSANGITEAQALVGWIYLNQVNSAGDQEKAEMWLTLSSAAGHSMAEAGLGLLFLSKADTDIKKKTAISMLEAAFNKGYVSAAVILGEVYSRGQWIDQNSELALHWYLQAAQKNSIDAFVWLSRAYIDGRAPENNAAEAAIWREKASEALRIISFRQQ